MWFVTVTKKCMHRKISAIGTHMRSHKIGPQWRWELYFPEFVKKYVLNGLGRLDEWILRTKIKQY